MTTEQTVKCPICSKPYKVYAFSAADQSACPSCVAQAEMNARRTVITTNTQPIPVTKL